MVICRSERSSQILDFLSQRAVFSLHVSSIIRTCSAQDPNELCPYLAILSLVFYYSCQHSGSDMESEKGNARVL